MKMCVRVYAAARATLDVGMTSATRQTLSKDGKGGAAAAQTRHEARYAGARLHFRA
jgi:hypothetical protein